MRDVPMARHSLRSCRIVGESMAPTMKSGVHENRHENLHGWRKIKKSFARQRCVLGASRFFKKRVLAGGALHDGEHEGVNDSFDTVANEAPGTPAFAWCRTVAVSQSSLRNTARPRRSPATPASGSAFMSSLGPWPSIDSRRRCEKSRVGGR